MLYKRQAKSACSPCQLKTKLPEWVDDSSSCFCYANVKPKQENAYDQSDLPKSIRRAHTSKPLLLLQVTTTFQDFFKNGLIQHGRQHPPHKKTPTTSLTNGPSSREISSLEKVRPGMRPRFFLSSETSTLGVGLLKGCAMDPKTTLPW